jgi:hypothetical protein
MLILELGGLLPVQHRSAASHTTGGGNAGASVLWRPEPAASCHCGVRVQLVVPRARRARAHRAPVGVRDHDIEWKSFASPERGDCEPGRTEPRADLQHEAAAAGAGGGRRAEAGGAGALEVAD